MRDRNEKNIYTFTYNSLISWQFYLSAYLCRHEFKNVNRIYEYVKNGNV